MLYIAISQLKKNHDLRVTNRLEILYFVFRTDPQNPALYALNQRFVVLILKSYFLVTSIICLGYTQIFSRVLNSMLK